MTTDPAKTTAVDDARKPLDPRIGEIFDAWDTYKRGMHAKGVGGKDQSWWLVDQILAAEAQLRQEREAKEAAYKEIDRLGDILRSENRLANKSGWDQLRAEIAQLQTTISQYRKTLADLQPRTFPFDCELCGKVIESTADYDWHGIGDCAPICGTCDGNGFVANITQKPKEHA